MAEESPTKERIERYQKLKSEREGFWDTLWQQIFDYELPRKSNITSVKSPSVENYTLNIYDQTVSDANEVLASGLMTNTTPATERWAVFESPYQLQVQNGASPAADKWYSQVSEITMNVLAGSKLYSELHEFHLERNPAGTSCIYVEEGKRNPLNFQTIPLGSYVFALDDEGHVDTVQREFRLTARQAAQKFGEERLGDKVRKALKSDKDRDKEFCFLHSVYPRSDADRRLGERDAENKPYISCYDSIEDKIEVQTGGYDEMPYVISRFRTWPGEVWGFSPGITALPIVRSLNQIEKDQDKLAEIAADPRLLIPSYLADTVDMTAGGATYYDESQGPNGVPRSWATEGRYDVGKDRAEVKREAIRKLFFNDLFQMLGQMEPGRLTAYEVMQRVSEKLEIFTPTFQRLTTELLEPLMLRVFGILFRGGYYPDPPQEVLVPEGADEAGNVVYGLAKPKVAFQSKMALAIRALENKSFIEFQQIIGPMLQLRPELLDNFDVDKISVDIARNLGQPADWINDPEVRDGMRQQRAQAEQAQQALMAAKEGSEAVANLGKMPPDARKQMGM